MLLRLNVVFSLTQSTFCRIAKHTAFEDSALFLRRLLRYPPSARPSHSTTASSAALSDDSLTGPFNQPGRPAAAPGFSALGGRLLIRLSLIPMPTGVISRPHLIGFSPDTAASLDISRARLDTTVGLAVFIGNIVTIWSDPLVTVYSDHQLDVWASQLGDNYALLLAGFQTADGPYGVQFRGAGRIPYSRMGDGRAVLRSSIRKFLCSGAVAGLGTPTIRVLCAAGADAPVHREKIETAAVITRLTTSFVRSSRLKHFAASEQLPQLRAPADYVINRSYPASHSEPQPYLTLLRRITRHTAELMADQQAISFYHGMMNTDNMSILGLTLSYGPFDFLGDSDANHICNHSDSGGRYVCAQQPQIGYWNLFCFAQALLPLFGEDPHVSVDLSDKVQAQSAIGAAQSVLLIYRDVYGTAFYVHYCVKLGLSTAQDADEALFGDLFELLHNRRTDYALLFRHLTEVRRDDTPTAAEARTIRDFFSDHAAAGVWLAAYRQRLQAKPQSDDERAAVVYRVNPKYILRNRLAEIAIRRAKEKDFSEVENLCAVLTCLFDDHPGFECYTQPAPGWTSSLEMSCSS